MTSTQDVDREDTRRLAYAVGQLVAEAGDFYDVVEYLALGYRDYVLSGNMTDFTRAVYTGSRQIAAGPEASTVPNFSAGQDGRGWDKSDLFKWPLVAMNEMRSVAEHSIAAVVGEARAARVTWSAIAEGLDITKQGAQKRYGTNPLSEYHQL
jgi:hypothetical protein